MEPEPGAGAHRAADDGEPWGCLLWMVVLVAAAGMAGLWWWLS